MRTERQARTSSQIGMHSRRRRLRASRPWRALFVARITCALGPRTGACRARSRCAIPATQTLSAPRSCPSQRRRQPCADRRGSCPAIAITANSGPPQHRQPGRACRLARPSPASRQRRPPASRSIGGDLLPQKLSLARMYFDADRVVKAVMIGLAFASLVTWTVLARQDLELRRARAASAARPAHAARCADARPGARAIARRQHSPVAQLMQAAAQEIRLSASVRGDGLKERIALQLERLEMAPQPQNLARHRRARHHRLDRAVRRAVRHRVGHHEQLHRHFQRAHHQSRGGGAGHRAGADGDRDGADRRHPGGVIYNVLARQTAHYRALLGDASAQVMRLVSRDLDRARLPLAQAAE